MIELLVIDNLEKREDEYFCSPDWKTVEENIRLLNGDTRSTVFLYIDEEDTDVFFVVGGGENGNYICQYYDGDEFAQINSLNKNDDSRFEIFLGQTSVRMRKEIVSLEQALEATKYYFEHATIAGYPNWEKL